MPQATNIARALEENCVLQVKCASKTPSYLQEIPGVMY